MPNEKDKGLRRIRRALISVSDKTGLVELANALVRHNVEILSTGGTASALRAAGVAVREVSDVTGFPEMLDGRVKTLHPRIHGGILAVRNKEEHIRALESQSIEPIDLVVINLYPFRETIAREGVKLEEAVEQIDIGGPAMVRSAAKNYIDVAVVVWPEDYEILVYELNKNHGALPLATREWLARRAFLETAGYDAAIAGYLSSVLSNSPEPPSPQEEIYCMDESFTFKEFNTLTDFENQIETDQAFPVAPGFLASKRSDLRYGENPHQRAALYTLGENNGVANAEVLGGKDMSFNNYVDADAAWQLVCDFDEIACAIIKHMNPSGVGTGVTVDEAYRRALATDPVSAFGGVVASNRAVDAQAAQAVTEIFTEVIVAPDYDESALEILSAKKNLRILRVNGARVQNGVDLKRITGGLLVQTRDSHHLKRDDLKVVSKRPPSENEVKALMFAWIVCKHTKSNAIVYARDGQTVGVGAGQMSRVDSVRLGAMRAQLPVPGSVLASDAFFPFRDGVDAAAGHGITAIIQPGGSVRDDEVIAAADEHDLAMVFTGVRHFRH